MITVEQILAVKGPDVIVTEPDANVHEVCRLMAEANVGSVIVRAGQEVRGIFTERDLLRRIVAAGKDPAATAVGEVMSSPVRHCRLHDDVSRCAHRLADGHIRHLAVIEDGVLIGLIGLRDIMRFSLLETLRTHGSAAAG
jgi:CBS domain-containing protein